MRGVYLLRTPGSREGSAVIFHCGRKKHPPTTGKSPKPIYLFRSLGPRAVTQCAGYGVPDHQLSLALYTANSGSPE